MERPQTDWPSYLAMELGIWPQSQQMVGHREPASSLSLLGSWGRVHPVHAKVDHSGCSPDIEGKEKYHPGSPWGRER